MKTLIIGCGRVGAGLAKNLALAGHAITVVDQDPAAFDRLGPTFSGERLVGIGFDRDVLVHAGIGEADSLAAVTGSDEANAVVARVANRDFHVPTVVARLYEPRRAEIYRRLGIQTISPVSWGVQRLSDLLSYKRTGPAVTLGAGQVNLYEFRLPSHLVGHTVSYLAAAGEVTVVAITRAGRTFLPDLPTVFEEGDVIHLAAAETATDRIQGILG